MTDLEYARHCWRRDCLWFVGMASGAILAGVCFALAVGVFIS